MRDKVLQIKEKLEGWFIDRDNEIEGLLLASLSGNHIFLLGPPGTGKTRLIRLFTDMIGGSTFKVQLGKFTEPRQLFGRLSINALENDQERYLDNNKLQKCDLAFIDEIWKASNAIVNDLLTVLEDKVFIVDGVENNIPLISCASASNELPTEGEGLEAIYDRFMLRYYTGDLSTTDFQKMLINPPPVKADKIMEIDEFRKAMGEIDSIAIDSDIPAVIARIREELKKNGIEASPRRWAKSFKIMKAHAWLEGASVVTDDQLIAISHVLWRKPEERETIADIIIKLANPIRFKIQQITDLGKELVNNLPSPDEDSSAEEKTQIMEQLFGAGTSIEDSITKLKALNGGVSTIAIQAGIAEMESYSKQIESSLTALVKNRSNKRD